MRTLDMIIGWLLIAFGVAHTSLTRKVDPSLGITAIWFASGGLFMITVGALNLLRVAYSCVAKGVQVVSVIANIVLLLLMLFIASRFPMRSNPQVVVGLILAALLTAFSVLRRPWPPRSSQAQTNR
ncbi:MAG TPA: hypothetical protein VLC12_12610 [Terriglobales bacterium]|nr:hypothetical protein [Terriglobales bacterium]